MHSPEVQGSYNPENKHQAWENLLGEIGAMEEDGSQAARQLFTGFEKTVEEMLAKYDRDVESAKADTTHAFVQQTAGPQFDLTPEQANKLRGWLQKVKESREQETIH